MFYDGHYTETGPETHKPQLENALQLNKKQLLQNLERARRARQRKTCWIWLAIQEIIGCASLWPRFIRRLFWTPNLQHFNRIIIATFCYVNGMHPHMMLEWARHMHLARDQAAVRHMRALYVVFEQNGGHYGGLYAWNVTQTRYEYIDGSVRHYVPKTQRNRWSYYNMCVVWHVQ